MHILNLTRMGDIHHHHHQNQKVVGLWLLRFLNLNHTPQLMFQYAFLCSTIEAAVILRPTSPALGVISNGQRFDHSVRVLSMSYCFSIMIVSS